jgi:hypothetical protein
MDRRDYVPFSLALPAGTTTFWLQVHAKRGRREVPLTRDAHQALQDWFDVRPECARGRWRYPGRPPIWDGANEHRWSDPAGQDPRRILRSADASPPPPVGPRLGHEPPSWHRGAQKMRRMRTRKLRHLQRISPQADAQTRTGDPFITSPTNMWSKGPRIAAEVPPAARSWIALVGRGLKGVWATNGRLVAHS